MSFAAGVLDGLLLGLVAFAIVFLMNRYKCPGWAYWLVSFVSALCARLWVAFA